MRRALVGIDLLAIQDFVFASNRVVHIEGASRLVADATEDDGRLIAALRAAGRPGGGRLLHSHEVLLGAGGNLVLDLDDQERAAAVGAFVGCWLAHEAPGLHAAVAVEPYEPGHLGPALLGLLDERLPAAKRFRRDGALLAPALVDVDVASGLPAAGLWRERVVGEGQLAAVRRQREDDDPWARYAPNGAPGATRYTTSDVEGWRTHGEQSWYAVVHLDGNGIGRRLRGWLDDHEHEPDDLFADGYRTTAAGLRAAAGRALRAMTDLLARSIAGDAIPGAGAVPEVPCASNGAVEVPLRPVLVAGDDLTVLCDARIALAAARVGVAAFGGDIAGLDPITATAGVAFTRAHAPASSAARAADEATRRAKENHGDTPAVAWVTVGDQPAEPTIATTIELEELAGILAELREGMWAERRSATKEILHLARAEHLGLPGVAAGSFALALERLDRTQRDQARRWGVTRLGRLAELYDLALFPAV